MEKVIRETTSICPECMQPIKAEIYLDESKGEKGWIMMRKTCHKHGEFFDKISIDPDLYIWKNGYPEQFDSWIETKPKNRENMPVKNGCPYDCGLCTEHESAANLMIIDITNRCNLNCPICFANSNSKGQIVEYTFEEVVRIMKHFAGQKPFMPAIAQFSGGEPTLHPRILDILQTAKDLGFPHRMLNTNGIRMAKDVEFCRQLKEVDCGAIYLSFDGLESETYKKIRGLDLVKIKKKVIDNCREVGLDGIMLVVTVAKEVNDHEIENIMNFAKSNNDIIAGVVFQPVSLCGRITLEDLMNMRYTSSDLTKELTRITDGKIGKFLPLATTSKLTALITWFENNEPWAMTAHEDCGWATLAPVDENGEWESLEDYVDLEGLIRWSNQVYDMVIQREIPQPSKLIGGLRKLAAPLGYGRLVDAFSEFSDKVADVSYRNLMKAYYVSGTMKHIRNFDIKKLSSDHIYKAITKLMLEPGLKNSKSLLHSNMMFVGSMHFQDAYDLDVARVRKCIVHYGVLDPADHEHVLEIPFCTFNTIHRDPIEQEWAKGNSKDLEKSTEQHLNEVKTLEKSLPN